MVKRVRVRGKEGQRGTKRDWGQGYVTGPHRGRFLFFFPKGYKGLGMRCKKAVLDVKCKKAVLPVRERLFSFKRCKKTILDVRC